MNKRHLTTAFVVGFLTATNGCKDYLDVSRLLEHGIGLAEALGAARAVYGPSFNPLPSLKALCYFGDGDLV
jgi:hypothetical protein